jgi:hypothetical protein
MTEVDDNFSSPGAALDLALSLDGSVKQFAFSDGTGTPPNAAGSGKIIISLNCLWNVSNENLIVRTHSHGTNYVLQNNQVTCVFHESDVPLQARIAANAYVDVDSVQYRIDKAELENGLYILDLQVFRSR